MVGLYRLFSSQSLTIACTIATVLSGGANAAVLDRRQGTDTTTSVTSTSTTESTTDAAKTTATTKKDSATKTSESKKVTATATPPDDDFPVCNDSDVVFCQPKNGTEMWPGQTYYVTWNAKSYPRNSTITVELNYANSSVGGESAYSSPRTDNRMGYVTMTMEEDWLQGHSRNNLTLYLVMDDQKSGDRATPRKGPTISLAPKPADHYDPGPPTPPPNKLGLAVGLPVGLGAIFLILIGLCIGMRKRRKIGLGSVMGRKKGYGSGKSRGQRLGRSRRENDAIRLGELEEDPDRYTDDPNVQRRDSEEQERMTGQTFRPDVGRLKTWR